MAMPAGDSGPLESAAMLTGMLSNATLARWAAMNFDHPA